MRKVVTLRTINLDEIGHAERIRPLGKNRQGGIDGYGTSKALWLVSNRS
ncbi:MAG: hypothetical protein ACJ788_13815 [Ktedonobacteraceae bacterium]